VTYVARRGRHHRKGLFSARTRIALLRCLWLPTQLNWWIGSVFAVGALLFVLGSVLILDVTLAPALSVNANAVYFAGSIPFSTAAYLQLYQAANAPNPALPTGRVAVFGWRPREIGWSSCALQFAGTLLFNISTFAALRPDLTWLQRDEAVWAPDFGGSVLFLLSGYLAFNEACAARWAWRPRELAWWITVVNLVGCVAFMISAVLSFVPRHALWVDAVTASVVCTLIGALGFLLGSLLMLPEAGTAVSS
jgi:hypothetical protein